MRDKPTIDLICIRDSQESLALRSVLEWWGVQVTLHLVGQARDLVDLLGGNYPLSAVVLLMCHGDERGIVLPELGEEYEKVQPYHGALTPADLTEFVRLPSGCVVISTGCDSGRAAFAAAFLASGCGVYIAPTGSIEGNASLFYLLHLAYGWLCQHQPLRSTHESARDHDEETRMFTLFEAATSG